MGDKTAKNAALAKILIEGKIRGLVKTLFTLASDPAHPGSAGAYFIHLDSRFKPASENDAMLGGLFMDNLLSAAFTAAANDNAGLGQHSFPASPSWDQISDAADEVFQDRHNIKSRGQGTYALGEHKSICNHFNAENAPNAAYLHDLPKRLRIEQHLAGLLHDLSGIDRTLYASAAL